MKVTYSAKKVIKTAKKYCSKKKEDAHNVENIATVVVVPPNPETTYNVQ